MMGYYIEQNPLRLRLADPVANATDTPTEEDGTAIYDVGTMDISAASCEEVTAETHQRRKSYRNGAVIATAICGWLGHRLYKKFN